MKKILINNNISYFNSISRFLFSGKNSFLKNKSHENNKEINIHFDYTKHTLLKNLYMFKFNTDNIGYVLHDEQTNSLIGIDFGEYEISSKVINNLEKQLNSKFRYLFTTHSHHDHCGQLDLGADLNSSLI